MRKIPPPTGNRSPDRPACSESLYRLGCPGRHSCHRPNERCRIFLNFSVERICGCQISHDVWEIHVVWYTYFKIKFHWQFSHLRKPLTMPHKEEYCLLSRYVMQAHLFCVEISSRTKCLAVVESLSPVVMSVYLTSWMSERDCTTNEIVVFTKPYKRNLCEL